MAASQIALASQEVTSGESVTGTLTGFTDLVMVGVGSDKALSY